MAEEYWPQNTLLRAEADGGVSDHANERSTPVSRDRFAEGEPDDEKGG